MFNLGSCFATNSNRSVLPSGIFTPVSCSGHILFLVKDDCPSTSYNLARWGVLERESYLRISYERQRVPRISAVPIVGGVLGLNPSYNRFLGAFA